MQDSRFERATKISKICSDWHWRRTSGDIRSTFGDRPSVERAKMAGDGGGDVGVRRCDEISNKTSAADKPPSNAHILLVEPISDTDTGTSACYGSIRSKYRLDPLVFVFFRAEILYKWYGSRDRGCS